MTNPLLTPSGLPTFSVILPQHVEPALDQVLADNRAAVARLLDTQPTYTWRGLVEPLE